MRSRSPHGVPRGAHLAAERMARAHMAAMAVGMLCVERLLVCGRRERVHRRAVARSRRRYRSTDRHDDGTRSRSPHGVPRGAHLAAERMARAHGLAMHVGVSCVDRLLVCGRGERVRCRALARSRRRYLSIDRHETTRSSSPHGMPRGAHLAAKRMARAHGLAMHVSVSCVERLPACGRRERVHRRALARSRNEAVSIDRPP